MFKRSSQINRSEDEKVIYHDIQREISPDNDSSKQPQIALDLEECDQLSGRRSIITTLILQLAAALWLVPIAVLLWLNFSNHIIGASAWCPDGHCYVDEWNPIGAVVQANIERLSKGDDDLLAALQFVAKGLEVWFSIIAAAFVYLITMRIAGQPEGLPVGFLTRPFEFADVVSLFDPLLWTTGPAPWGARQDRKLGRRVFGLIFLTISLCVLCNLMGPATAVLVIPSLGWIPTPSIGNFTFTQLNAGTAPGFTYGSWFWWETAIGCSPADYDAWNYSCTHFPLGDSLDAWVQSYIASGAYVQGFTNADGLTLAVNYSSASQQTLQNYFDYSDVVFWAPNRQVISNLSVDLQMIQQISEGYSEQSIVNSFTSVNVWPDPYDTYLEYNKSLDLIVERNGPISGAITNMWTSQFAPSWFVEVDQDRQLRCYPFYNLFWSPLAEDVGEGNYTKCIRTGNGWLNSEQNNQASFSIQGFWNETTNRLNPSVEVEIFSSDRAVFFKNGVQPTWFPDACLTDGPVLNRTYCDWKRLFTIDPESPVANRSANVNTIEMTMKQGDAMVTLAVDFTAIYSFTKYSFDPFPQNNPTQLVQTQDLPSTGTSFAIHPAWILAGWSVDDGGVLPSDRATTHALLEVLQLLLTPNDQYLAYPGDGIFLNNDKLGIVSLLPVLQTLSLIDYSTIQTSNTAASTQDPSQVPLRRTAQMYVWSYGIHSRTAWLGAIVAMFGSILVIAHVILGLLDMREYRSPTQLLVAALEHAPRGEFHERHEDKRMAQTRFHIKDDLRLAGRLSFYSAS